MNCELIFYLARKTGLCEKTLKKVLNNFNLNLKNTSFAADPQTLGSLICKGFAESNILFVTGGLEFSDAQGIKNVLSKALAYEDLDDVKKIENQSGFQDGFLFRRGNQLLIVMPDQPKDMENMFKEPLFSYILQFCEHM